MNKAKLYAALIISSLFLFVSCAPVLTVQANGAKGADISIKTTMQSAALSELLGTLEVSAFSERDLASLLKETGFENTKADIAPSGEITSSGSCSDISKNPALPHLISRTENSLTFTAGASQWQSIYESSGEESRGYLDLLMIPALTGESMTTAEYRSLLSSVYGPSLASEVVDTPLVIYLSSPSGAKKTKITTTLGALLSRTEEKSWSVQW